MRQVSSGKRALMDVGYTPALKDGTVIMPVLLRVCKPAESSGSHLISQSLMFSVGIPYVYMLSRVNGLGCKEPDILRRRLHKHNSVTSFDDIVSRPCDNS